MTLTATLAKAEPIYTAAPQDRGPVPNPLPKLLSGDDLSMAES
jgi:hypothetical protein